MKITVTSPPLANDTAYGFELRYLDMARELAQAGLTAKDMKDIARNLALAYKVIQDEMGRQIREQCEKIYVKGE